jgi:hypothetical protein
MEFDKNNNNNTNTSTTIATNLDLILVRKSNKTEKNNILKVKRKKILTWY